MALLSVHSSVRTDALSPRWRWRRPPRPTQTSCEAPSRVSSTERLPALLGGNSPIIFSLELRSESGPETLSPNKTGAVIRREVVSAWREIPFRYPGIVLDAYDISPERFRGILVIPEPELVPAVIRSIPIYIRDIIGWFKERVESAVSSDLWSEEVSGHFLFDEASLRRARTTIKEPIRRWWEGGNGRAWTIT